MEIMVANQIARNVLGLQPSDTRLPDALANQFGVRRQDLATRGSTHIFQFTLSLERHDVGSMHLEVTYAPAVLNREEVFFCAITDMTEHHRAERLLREAKRTSEEAARAKVNFFASMSHEIRTPLASLVGNIELVALGPLAAEQQARVRAMQVSAKGLLQVVNDVLDFSKIDVGELSLSEEWTSITDLLCRIAVLVHEVGLAGRGPQRTRRGAHTGIGLLASGCRASGGDLLRQLLLDHLAQAARHARHHLRPLLVEQLRAQVALFAVHQAAFHAGAAHALEQLLHEQGFKLARRFLDGRAGILARLGIEAVQRLGIDGQAALIRQAQG